MNNWHKATTREGMAVGVRPSSEGVQVWGMTLEGAAVAGVYMDAEKVDGRWVPAGISHGTGWVAWNDLSVWQEAPSLARNDKGEIVIDNLPF